MKAMDVNFFVWFKEIAEMTRMYKDTVNNSNTDNELFQNIEKVHTTVMGVTRIKKNLSWIQIMLLIGAKPK